MGLQFFAPAPEPEVCGLAFLAGARSEEGDTAVALADEVTYGGTGRGHVVDGDVVVRCFVLALAEQDQWRGLGARHEVLGLQVDGAEDESVDHMGAEALADQELLLPESGGVVDQDGVVVAGGRVDDGSGEFREVRVAEFGDGEGDDAGAALAQMAGGEVRPVAELVDRLLHLGAHRGCDVLIVVHHVRHGLDGHARPLCNVLEADAHGTPWFGSARLGSVVGPVR